MENPIEQFIPNLDIIYQLPLNKQSGSILVDETDLKEYIIWYIMATLFFATVYVAINVFFFMTSKEYNELTTQKKLIKS